MSKVLAVRFKTLNYRGKINIRRYIIFRLHKKHDDGPVSFESKILSEYPDYPQRSDGLSKEDYNEAVKNFFKLKGKVVLMVESQGLPLSLKIINMTSCLE